MFNYIDLEKLKYLFTYDKLDPLVFTSSLFLFCFLALLLLYRLVNRSKGSRIILLLLFSVFFYYKASGIYFLFLFLVSFLNFFLGKWMFKTESRTGKRWVLTVALVLNLGMLVYFKYTNFFIQIYNDLRSATVEPLQIILPIGISFFIFKALSYVLDIYYENMEPVKSVRDFTLYIFYFPTLLAGPIERASNFLPQVDEDIKLTKEMIGTAVFLIMSGIIKKVVIADYIGINFVDRVFDSPLRFTGVENALAAFAYSLQLYTDFSGYTDMALGISLLLGYRLTDNFNAPFKATSIAEFWRRWHITLSSWLLDYLFKPLQMKFRSMRNFGNALALFITFTVIGLWHGANWTFIVFGVIHGTYLATSIFTRKLRQSFYKKTGLGNNKIIKFLQWLMTFILVVFANIFFRAQDLQFAKDMLSQIFTFFHAEVFAQFVQGYKLIFALIIIGYGLHFLPEKWKDWSRELVIKTPLVGKAVFLTIVIWLAIQFRFADLQPFLYFQF